MRIEYKKKAVKFLESLDRPTKQRIKAAILPESEQNFALEIIKKLVLAWDSDYTRLTPFEKASLDEAMADSETIFHEDINWD